jgi:RNA polymerase sigma factor (sigma-70 family)
VTITQEQFDSLLGWLSTDRELAATKYETIRAALVRIFVSKGFNDAEDLADKTINRVMVRLPQIRGIYTGEPAWYFHGVARYIIRETRRRKEIASNLVDVRIDPPTEIGEEYNWLQRCLESLPYSQRNLILDYYLYEGHEKVQHHKQMAVDLKITEGALRSRVHQIRLRLEDCMRQCSLRRNCRGIPQSLCTVGASACGTKHIRQRASYLSEAPTATRSSDSKVRCE